MVRVTLGVGVGVGVGVEAGVGIGSGSVLVLGLGFDKDCGVLHRAELLRAQEVTRLGRPGQRAHHDVALLEERAFLCAGSIAPSYGPSTRSISPPASGLPALRWSATTRIPNALASRAVAFAIIQFAMSPYPTSPSVFPCSTLISNLSHTLSSWLRMQRGTCFVKCSAAVIA
jgi:hypothetical protein